VGIKVVRKNKYAPVDKAEKISYNIK
jgi:hypothetical protein